MGPCLYFVRHGETEWSLSGQHTGLTDIPLTARGEDEARALKARLEPLAFSCKRSERATTWAPESSAILRSGHKAREPADGVDEGQMKKAIPITTLFLDIGGSCSPTDGLIRPASGRRPTSSWSGPRWRIGIT